MMIGKLICALLLVSHAVEAAQGGKSKGAEQRSKEIKKVKNKKTKEHWTPENKKAAKSREYHMGDRRSLRGLQQDLTVANELWSEGGDFQTSVGLLYFTFASVNYRCSATVVKEEVSDRSIVLTAAHCAYDEVAKAFASNFLFCSESSSSGCWAADFPVVDQNWSSQQWPSNSPWDFAFLVISDEDSYFGPQTVDPVSNPLDVAVAAFPVDFDSDPTGSFTHLLGYPGSTGEELRYCADEAKKSGNYVMLEACNLRQGASGGPFIASDEQGSESIVSVMSWIVADGEVAQAGGPSLQTRAGFSAECLLDLASTQALGVDGVVVDGSQCEIAEVVTPPAYMESLLVAGVAFNDWTTVTLTEIYVSPIPVCTVQYEYDGIVANMNLRPAVPRIHNIGATSFDLKLQDFGIDIGSKDVHTVHCVVVEEGAWTLSDGRQVEAHKYTSSKTSNVGNYDGEHQTYSHTYAGPPAVLGQVISTNFPSKSSVFWSSDSGSPKSAPSAKHIETGKLIGLDINDVEVIEDIGWIAIGADHSAVSGVELETGRGQGFIGGYAAHDQLRGQSDMRKQDYAFMSEFSTSPEVTVASQAGQRGPNGSFAVLMGPADMKNIFLAVDEDDRDRTIHEREHKGERVHYMAFWKAGVFEMNKL